jgi:hypothetical protein
LNTTTKEHMQEAPALAFFFYSRRGAGPRQTVMAHSDPEIFSLTLMIMALLILCAPFSGHAATMDPPDSDLDVIVRGHREIAAGAPFSLRIIVRGKDGRPAKGVPVEIHLDDERGRVVSRFSSKTDEEGTMSPKLATPPDEGRGFLNILVNTKEFIFPLSIRVKRHMEVTAVIKDAPRRRALAVKVRLLKKPFFQPLAGKALSISLIDGSARMLSRKYMHTNESGMAFAELPFPPKGSGESFQLRIDSDGDEQGFPLRLPDIEGNDFSLLMGMNKRASIGEALTGTVKAFYRDGRPLEGASISLSIMARGAQEKALAKIERETDREGVYRFKFIVPNISPESSSTERRLMVHVKAQKGAKQAEAREELAVSSAPFCVNCWAERRLLKRGLSNRISVMALDEDLSPLPLNVAVTWKEGKKELNLRDAGRASFDLTGTGESAEFTIDATDASGRTLKKRCSIPVDAHKESLLGRTGKTVLNRGEKVEMEYTSTVQSAPLYVDVMAADSTICTLETRLERGRATLKFPLDECIAGIITVRSYIIIGKESIDDETQLFIDPASPSKADIAPLKDRFIPGEILPLLLTLQSPKDSSPYLDFMLVAGEGESPPPAELIPASPSPGRSISWSLLFTKRSLPARQKELLAPLLLRALEGPSRYGIEKIPQEPAAPDSCLMDLAMPPVTPQVAYFYESLIKTDEHGQVKKDIRLPTHNFKGRVMTCPSSGGPCASRPITIYQQYMCDIPLLYSAVTEGDSLALPVRLVNYGSEESEITLEISKRPWFTLQGERVIKRVIPGKGEGFAFFKLNNLEAGTGKIAVEANMGGDIQEVRGELSILPRAQEGTLFRGGVGEKDFKLLLHFPQHSRALDRKLFLNLSGGTRALSMRALESFQGIDLVTSEGLASRIRLDLNLNGMDESSQERRTGRERILEDSSELAHYERAGGGFASFKGDEPDCLATARALMALRSLMKHSGGNEEIITRSRKWLLERRAPEGSWKGREGLSSLSTTAFITWMLQQEGSPAKVLGPSTEFLKSHREDMRDSFTLALATAILRNEGSTAATALDLEKRVASSALKDEASMHWSCGDRKEFPGDIITTSLAAMALGPASLKDDERRKIARFLIEHQGPDGSWGPSDETLLALEALTQLCGTTTSSGTVVLEIQGKKTHSIRLGSDDREVFRKLDLTEYCRADDNDITVAFYPKVDDPFFWQIVEKFPLPEDTASGDADLSRSFSATQMKRNEKTECTFSWKLKDAHDIAVLKVPLPWGFKVDRDLLELEKEKKRIAGYRLGKYDLLIYIRGNEPDGKLTIPFTALLPCTIWARPAEILDYRHGRKLARSGFARLTVE